MKQNFKCTLFVPTHIRRRVSGVQRKVEVDGKGAKISNNPAAFEFSSSVPVRKSSV